MTASSVPLCAFANVAATRSRSWPISRIRSFAPAGSGTRWAPYVPVVETRSIARRSHRVVHRNLHSQRASVAPTQRGIADSRCPERPERSSMRFGADFQPAESGQMSMVLHPSPGLPPRTSVEAASKLADLLISDPSVHQSVVAVRNDQSDLCVCCSRTLWQYSTDPGSSGGRSCRDGMVCPQ